MMLLIWIFGTVALAYGLGSIPFGLLLTRASGMGDIRTMGSGNIGATNVMRTGHKGLGLLTLLFDAGKGAAAVLLVRYIYFTCDLTQIAALFAVIGHVFPVWLKFKGGKGVATAIGALTAIEPMLGLGICVMWLISFAFTRYASLASLMAIGYSSIIAYVLDDYLTALLCLNLAALIIFTHRSNITRLLSGTERSFRKNA